MERLTYNKMNNSDNVLTIDLHNGYTVISISGLQPEKHVYITTLFIKDDTIDTWQLIEAAEKLEFHADHKTVNSAILKQVSTYLNEGFFDSYIKSYDFERECINCGYGLVESAREIY